MNNIENNSSYNNFLTSLKAYLYDESVKLNTLSTDNSAVIALAQQEVAFLSQINPYVEKIGELLENIENISINIDSLNKEGSTTNTSSNEINGLPELQPLNIDDVNLNPNLEVEDNTDNQGQVELSIGGENQEVTDSPVVTSEETNSIQAVPVVEEAQEENQVVVPSVTPAPVEVTEEVVQPPVEESASVVPAVVPAPEEAVAPVVEETAPAETPQVTPTVTEEVAQPPVEENTSVVPTVVATPEEATVTETATTEVQSEAPSVNDTPLVSDITSSISNTVDISNTEPSQGSEEVDINSVIYNKVDTNPVKAVLTSSSQIKKLRSSRVNCEMAFFNTVVNPDTAEAKQKKIEYLMAQASQLYNEGKKQEAQVLYDEIRKINDELQSNS